MSNKINNLFANSKDKKLLSLYFCAGCPTLEGTADVILTMQRRGIAMIEVGIPFSDPLADGPVIQSAATQALKNGMNLKTLFAQLREIKDKVEIPLVLMGYLNPILHYGIEEFCKSCVESGVSPRPAKSAFASSMIIPTALSIWFQVPPSPVPRRVSTMPSRSISAASTL